MLEKGQEIRMNIAVIFAGGTGQRMHSKDVPKQFLKMHKKPIIIYTLEMFENHPEIDAIVVACKEDWISYLNNLLYQYRIEKVKKVVSGGETGQMSIYYGLVGAEEISNGENAVVLIHDGVRPLINQKLISDNIASVRMHGSAITTGVVQETIMIVTEEGEIAYVPDRAYSRVAKAPQSFWLNDILIAHQNAQAENKFDFIDSCTMMKYYNHDLFLVDGPLENIKITTPSDYYTMRALLDAQENEQLFQG